MSSSSSEDTGQASVDAGPDEKGGTLTSAEIISVREGKLRQRPPADDREPQRVEPVPSSPQSEPSEKWLQENEKSIPSDAEPVADVGATVWRKNVESSVLPALVGGLAGAMMAVVAVFLINQFRPPMDPRVQPMTEQLGTFIQRMETQETGLRATQVDLVSLLEGGEQTSEKIEKQDERIKAALTEVDLARKQLQRDSGPGSPIFGVAVVQLDNAISSGRPFEAEWVTVYSLMAEDPVLREDLLRVSPLARDGVRTINGLRQDLQLIAKRNDIPNTSVNKGLVHMGAMFLQDKLGVPLGPTPAFQVLGTMLGEADERLRNGDISGTISMISRVDASHTDLFVPWIEEAKRRQVAGEVAATLRNVADKRLRERVSGKAALSDASSPLRMAN